MRIRGVIVLKNRVISGRGASKAGELRKKQRNSQNEGNLRTRLYRDKEDSFVMHLGDENSTRSGMLWAAGISFSLKIVLLPRPHPFNQYVYVGLAERWLSHWKQLFSVVRKTFP